MGIAFQKLEGQPRLLMEARLKPLQGDRFQPTGFADLGPARYTLPDGTAMLLVESAQSVANRMELACWDEGANDLIKELKGLPYIRVDCGSLGKTNSILEFHRLNSPYIWEGEETDKTKVFKDRFCAEIGISSGAAKKKKEKKEKKGEESEEKDSVAGILDFRKFHKAVFKWDPNSVIHGLFLEKVAGRLRMTRLLSGFIEAAGAGVAESGGTKVDHVLPRPKDLGLKAEEGFGNVPFHRTEFTAERITAYFNLDLALLRGYGLSQDAERLLVALALFKVRRFLSTGLRLRTACDLEAVEGLVVTRPDGFVIPDEKDLLEECRALIAKCKPLFADPAVTEVEWKPSKKEDKGKGKGNKGKEAMEDNAEDDDAGTDQED